MRRINAILPRVLASHQLASRIKEFEVLTKWHQAVGETIASHTSAVDIARGHLSVRVDHPVWSHHLSLLKPSLIAKLNEAVGSRVVSDIRFSL